MFETEFPDHRKGMEKVKLRVSKYISSKRHGIAKA